MYTQYPGEGDVRVSVIIPHPLPSKHNLTKPLIPVSMWFLFYFASNPAVIAIWCQKIKVSFYFEAQFEQVQIFFGQTFALEAKLMLFPDDTLALNE